MAVRSLVMNNPYTSTLRHLRRSAGLTQDDVARILGTGGRSYVAMLESGDRVPHVRDTLLLAMLFGTSEADLFPHIYSITRETFQSNARALIEDALKEEGGVNSERLRFLREAMTSVQLSENVAPIDL
jgi:transcriptional regulator with XRE-family HTH domain